MMRSIRSFSYLLLGVFLLASCRKDFADYYDRPESLAPPIYQQLEERKNFTNLLSCIDKSGYKEILQQGGSWTFFAPDDAAFSLFYKENGISGIDDPKMNDLAGKIVRYCLLYNTYRKDQLALYQTSTGGTGRVADITTAFKRKTAYYDFVVPETKGGLTRQIMLENRNGGTHILNDNNNKYLPYFLDNVFQTRKLTAADYNFFYPSVSFTGFNVLDAHVTEQDIPAENGTLHIIDKVLTPQPNLSQLMASKPEYSDFKELFDSTAVYLASDELTKRYQAVSKTSDSVYIKFFSTTSINPANENYLLASTDAQQEGYTVYVPSNDKLREYKKEILKYYNNSFRNAPVEILKDFLDSHIWPNAVWPNSINEKVNVQNEPITFTSADITDRKVASNGFFYGINGVQKANVFRSVYGQAYLNPAYSVMRYALDVEHKLNILIPSQKFTMFLFSNEDFKAAKYFYDAQQATNKFGYQATTTISYSTTSRDRFVRIMNLALAPAELNGFQVFNDLSGKGIIETNNGEYIKYDNYKIYASGNVDAAKPFVVNPDSTVTASNGKVYRGSGVLLFTENNIGFHLEALAASDPANYKTFVDMLKVSSIYNATDKTIVPLPAGYNYTIFVPTNAAIQKAANDGVLPKDAATGTVKLSPTAAEKDIIDDFLKLHMIEKTAIAVNGIKEGPFSTVYKDKANANQSLTITNLSKTAMQVSDAYGRVANVNYAASNNLSNRTLIHSIDTYLKPKAQ